MFRPLRTLTTVLVVVVSISLLAWLGTSPTAAKSPASSATLTFWNGFTGPDRPAVEALVSKFNASHPGITVQMTITPWDSLYQKLPASLTSGVGPDIMGIDSAYVPQYATSGYIRDLSPVYSTGGLKPSTYPRGLLDVLKFKGKFYAAPMSFFTTMLYYNKDMFARAHITQAPRNWTQWIADIKKLTKHSGGVDQYGLAIGTHDTVPNWQLFIWGNGGDIIKAGKPALASRQTVQALKLWTGLVKNDRISPINLAGADADKLFQSQRAAMEVSGPWLTTGLTQAGLHYDVAPLPAGPAGPVTFSGSDVLLVNARSKNAQAAFTFIKYWNTKQSELYYSVHAGFPPARIDFKSTRQLRTNPWVFKFWSVAPTARFYLPGQQKYQRIDTDVFVPMMQQILYGRQSVEAATKSADQQIAKILAGG